MAIKDIDNVYYISENIHTNEPTFIRNAGEFLDSMDPNKANRLKRNIFEKKAQVIIDKLVSLIIFNSYN